MMYRLIIGRVGWIVLIILFICGQGQLTQHRGYKIMKIFIAPNFYGFCGTVGELRSWIKETKEKSIDGV
jgi:hypothetical protein